MAAQDRHGEILLSKTSRRTLMKAAGGTAVGLSLAATGTAGDLRAWAQTGEPTGTVTYLSANNFIGNWNPYANLVLSHMRVTCPRCLVRGL